MDYPFIHPKFHLGTRILKVGMIQILIISAGFFFIPTEANVYAVHLVNSQKCIIAQGIQPDSRPEAGSIWEEPVTGIEFVWIPVGCFNMGNSHSNLTEFFHEKPAHRVCLAGFWMGRFEVTNAQFRKYKSGHQSGSYSAYSLNEDNQPAVLVSWNDAKNYANWLTEQSEGRHLFRLPTEAEWEYACRAKTTMVRYWGNAADEACDHANIGDTLLANGPNAIHFCRDDFLQSSPVGCFDPNPFGLYDMLGNVWEWCQDVYGKDAYKNHKRKNPLYQQIEVGIDLRVIRGGSWQSGPGSVRCAKRGYNLPDKTFNVLGFRLVMEP